MRRFGEERFNMESRAIYDILRSEFANKNSKNDLLIPFLITFLNSREKKLAELKAKNEELKQTADEYKKRVAELEAEVNRIESKE